MPLSSVYLPCIPQRFVMCALAFIGTTFGWMMYFNGYNTLREEINPSNNPTITSGTKDDKQIERCFRNSTKMTFMHNDIEKTSSHSSLEEIMWSVWIGYLISTIVSGIAADTCGPKHVWSLGILVTSVASFVLKFSFKISHLVGLVCLFFAGLGVGVISSCSSVVVAYWAPENARTMYSAIIGSGQVFALTIDFILHIYTSSWENCLIASGILSVVWIILWYALFYNRPAQHPHISRRELRYITKRTVGVSHSDDQRVTCNPVVAWKQIFSSPPFISLALCSFASSWVQSMVFYQMQTYIIQALQAPLLQVPGTTAAGIALVIALDSLIVNGWISDKLLSNSCTTRTNIRRFFILFPNYLSAVLLISIVLLGCAVTLVSLIFLFMIHLQGMGFPSICANAVDLAPRYAGILRGVLAMGRGLAILFTRELAMRMVEHPDSYVSWKWYFVMSAAIAIVFSASYFCFGSGEIQRWNYYSQNETTEGTTSNPSTDPDELENSSSEQTDSSMKK